ncbi:protoporphyrinogen oxidase [Niallia sp. Krafla_26]|uniref:protoporphyrinogen oxidase n=1 Tax=Niallia sp. Krafla_26 TaxID=3064703 RepID=UPI003D1635AB
MKLEHKKQIVIIGGGITGLSAAYYLQKAVREKHLPYDVTLIEASHRLGGQLQTYKRNGYVIERGPDCFLESQESATRLALEVGLGDQLVHNKPTSTLIYAREQLHSIPGGAVIGIPTDISPLLKTNLFSFPGKIRAAGDFILPKSHHESDQSLGTFFRHRFGDEVVENFIEPLLSGVFAGDIDKMSLMALFPHFYQIEQKYRSLILGMKKMSLPMSKEFLNDSRMFLSFKTGMQSFADGIAKKLNPESVKLGYRVEKIRKRNKRYEVVLNGGNIMMADSIIMAVPHQTLNSVLSDYSFLQSLKGVPATSIATVALGFPKDAIEKDMDATNVLVSRNSDSTITSCSCAHKVWPHTTPQGKVLYRCFVGRAGREVVVDLSDDQIVNNVLADLKNTFKISGSPELSVVSRWPNSIPQYTVGHLQRMEKVQQGLTQELPGIFLAGKSYNGEGVSACVKQGEEAVNNVMQYMMNQSGQDVFQIG